MTAAPYDAVMKIARILVSASLLLAGCGAHDAAPPMRATRTTAAPASDVAESRIVIDTGYPATLFYALDAAAGVRNRDSGYRAWLYEGDQPPEWLTSYAARRTTWTATVDDSGGGTPAVEACARHAASVTDALTCMERVVPESDRPILETAAKHADERVAPHYRRAAPQLVSLAGEMRGALASSDARALFATLRHEAALEADAPLRFEVILVAKPDGAHSYAMQSGESLVHEVGSDETSGDLLAVAFHEIAHLAHRQSPRRRALEEAFVALGDDGLFASNMWDEAVASAFGNGLAGERFRRDFSPDQPLYADRRVAALGRALYMQWRGGADVVLGPELAAWLTETARAQTPPSARTMGDLMWSVVATAESSAPLKALLRGVPYRSASRRTPIDDDLSLGATDPLTATRVVLATAGELAQHPQLRARFLLDEGDVLGGASSRVVRRPADGPLEVLLVASTADELLRASSALARAPVPAR